MLADANAEDEILYVEGNPPRDRLIRGIIVGEDAQFWILERRDGTWYISKEKTIKVRRAGGRR